jgi:hypothetical protein
MNFHNQTKSSILIIFLLLWINTNAFAGATTITFSTDQDSGNPRASENDNIAEDGYANSADRAGVVIQIYVGGSDGISDNEGIFVVGIGSRDQPKNTIVGDKSPGDGGVAGYILKSSDGSEFSFESFLLANPYNDWEEAVTIAGYKDGALIGSNTASVAGSSDYDTLAEYTALNQGDELTDSNFNNIDEVRIYRTDTEKCYFGMNSIIINDPVLANTAPTNITLTSTNVNQSAGTNANVGTLGSTDDDSGDSFTYEIVSGSGDTHNTLFNISGTSLRANNSSAMDAGSYSVRVQTTDSGSESFSKAFTITVIDDVAPTFSTITIASNNADTTKSKVGDEITLTFTASETISTPTVTIAGATATVVNTGGNNYTAKYTMVDTYTLSGVTYTLTNFSDSAGNAGARVVNTTDSSRVYFDKTAPTIAITSSHSSLKAGEVATLTFTLSENSTNFALADITATGGTIASFAGSGSVYTVSFTPTASSTAGATIDVTANKFTDTSGNGNSVAPQITMSVDTLVPTLTSTSPVDDATGVSKTTNIVLTMSENVNAGTGNIIIYDSTDAQIESIPISDTKVTISGRTVSIDPSTSLALNTLYYVKIASGVLVNASGNAYAGISDKTSWNFTTVSNQAPTLNGAVANQAVNDNATINPFANIVLADGDGDNISLAISLNNDAYGTLSASTVLSGTVASVQASLRAIVFTPTPNRVAVGSTETTVLTITLNDGTVTPTPDSITTVVITSYYDAPTDITLSSVSVNQSGGANAVVGNLTTTDVDTADSFTYVLVAGDGDSDNGSFNIDGADLRANDSGALSAGDYNIRIQTADATSATYEEKFTITVIDDIKPTILTLSPVDNVTAVAVDSDLVITFNTDIVKDTGNIVIKKSSDDSTIETIVASSELVTISGAVVTINPTTNLNFNTEYYIQIDNSSFKDSAGNSYAGISDTTSWSFTTVDSFSVSKTTASVNESGTTDTITVVLNSQPTNAVVFSITSADTDEATLSPDTLTFTNANWNTPQTVTITGVDDSVFDGSQNTIVTISIDDAQSDDAFDTTDDKTVTVSTTDDDSVGITLDKSSLTLTENGGSDTFTINLNTIPTHDVTVQLTTTANCTLSTTSVILDSMAGEEVTVTAVDDSIDNGTDRTCTINTGDPTSSDSNYGNLVATDVANVSVTLTDDDVAGFTLSKTTASVNESGTTNTFTVILNSQPTADVVFDIVSSDTDEAIVDLATLTFTDSNWNIAQTVTISGVDDSSVDGNQNSTITISVNNSSDSEFTALASKSVTVTTTDNDVAPVVVIPTTTSTDDNSTTVVEEKVDESVVEEKLTNTVVEEKPVSCTSTLSATELSKPIYGEVTMLYIATFGRAPDSNGLCYWVNESGMDINGISKSFFDQDETKDKYPDGYDDYDFIVSVYQNLFKRNPDQAGGDYWLKELSSGAIDRSEFILAIINGAIGDDALMLDNQETVGTKFVETGSNDVVDAEDIMQNITSDSNSMESALDSLDTFVQPSANEIIRLYIATLGRAPDSAGLEYWLNNSNMSLEQIAISFFDQDETKDKYPDGYSDYDFIVSVYQNLFKRTPDSAGLEYWEAELANGNIDRALFILAIINGATGDDAIILDNQTTAGAKFVESESNDIEN